MGGLQRRAGGREGRARARDPLRLFRFARRARCGDGRTRRSRCSPQVFGEGRPRDGRSNAPLRFSQAHPRPSPSCSKTSSIRAWLCRRTTSRAPGVRPAKWCARFGASWREPGLVLPEDAAAADAFLAGISMAGVMVPELRDHTPLRGDGRTSVSRSGARARRVLRPRDQRAIRRCPGPGTRGAAAFR